jgi:hypothetical protein
MAIRVSCPSCQSEVHVDDTLAGKDIICPSCRERLTVPSLATGRPEMRPEGASRDDYDRDDDRIRKGRREDAGMPRWSDGDDDYNMPRRHDPTRWNATLTGLALMFWSHIAMVALVAVVAVAAVAMGASLQQMFGNPGAPPPPGAAGVVVGILVFGCLFLVVFIIFYVGMCMCCTVPSECGAKGRAITAVVLVGVTILGSIIVGMAMGIHGINQGRGGQIMIAPTALVVISIVTGLAYLLIVALWMMFHRAIAVHFQSPGLARGCVWFVVMYAVYAFGHQTLQILQIMDNPMFAAGNIAAMQLNSPMLIIGQIWAFAWILGLSIAFLLIIRATRRAIVVGHSADYGDPMDDDRG